METKKGEEVIYCSPDGKYKIEFIHSEEGLIFGKAQGYESFESSKAIVGILRQYKEQIGQKLLLCLDATEYTGLDPESRKFMLDAIIGKDAMAQRFAVIGGNFLTRNLFNMYSKVSYVPMKIFSSEEKAIEWLVGK